MDSTNHKSLKKLIQSNEIAYTTSKAFLSLGCAAICSVGSIKTGLDILQVLPTANPTLLISILGFQGVGAIAGSYLSAMNFVYLGQILENEQNTKELNKPKMR
jgi:hypothetical protein